MLLCVDYSYLSINCRHDRKTFRCFFFQTHSYDFNTQNALIQIYAYVEKYGDQILATLDSNPEARRQRLQEQLENVYMPMNGSTQP